MEIQNIRVDFIKETLTSRFEDKIYTIDYNSISNLQALKTELETAFNLTIEQSVVSLTESEYGVGAKPRIWTGYGENGFDITNLEDIAANEPTLYQAFRDTRVLIEAEITNQLNA